MILYIIQDIGAFNLFFSEIFKINKNNLGSDFKVLTKKSNSRINFKNNDFEDTDFLFIEDLSYFEVFKILLNSKLIHVEMASTLFRPSKFFLANFFRSKLIFTVHGWVFQNQSLLSFFSSLLLVNIKKVFVLNRSDLLILNKFNSSVEKIRSLGFGVIDERLGTQIKTKDLKKNKKQISISFVGRLNEIKGFHILPNFIKNLISMGYEIKNFNVIGDVDHKRNSKIIKTSIDSLKTFHFVNFVGFTDSVKSFMMESDYIVLPSKREGISIAMCEALILKKPLITYFCRGADDLLKKEFAVDCSKFGCSYSLAKLLDKFNFDNNFLLKYLKFVNSLSSKLMRKNNSKIIADQYLKAYSLN